MKKIYYIIIFLFLGNCTLKNPIDHHGVHFLEKKEKKLLLNQSNKDDIVELLGTPSTKSDFNENLWIYIERKSASTLINNSRKKNLITNNVLILEINDVGLLVKKDFLTKNDMNGINFSEEITGSEIRKDSVIYSFLASMRSKINDPLGKKRKKISDR